MNTIKNNQEVVPTSQFIQIPFSILPLKDLSANEKLLFGLVKSYSQKSGYCYATNQHMATMLGLSRSTISGLLKGLKSKGYITTTDVYLNNWSYQFQRRIYLTDKVKLVDPPDTSHAQLPVQHSSKDGCNTDTPLLIDDKGGREGVIPDPESKIGDQNDLIAYLDNSNPDLESRNIIDNNNTELEIDNENKELLIDNNNRNLVIHSSSKNSITGSNSNDYNLIKYYSDEDVEKYFKNEMFQLYWKAAVRNPNHRTKKELLEINLPQRRHNGSFKLFNKICLIVDEKEASNNKRRKQNVSNSFRSNSDISQPISNNGNSINGDKVTQREKIISEFLKSYDKKLIEEDNLEFVFGRIIDEYFKKFQQYPNTINDKNLDEIFMRVFNEEISPCES